MRHGRMGLCSPDNKKKDLTYEQQPKRHDYLGHDDP
jgi:hypothetical protein